MRVLILILIWLNFLTFLFLFDLFSRESFVAFLNIGQGSSVLIYNPRLQMLYDAGPYGFETISEINKLLPFYDRDIDLVFISHPDKDHYGGLFSILERYKVRAIITPPVNSTESGYLQLLKKIKEKNIPLIYLKKGDKIETNFEDILVLNPKPKMFKSDNQNSLVLKVSKNNKTFLLTGDIDYKVERYLVKEYGNILKADYVLLPHHGSKYSSSDIFLKNLGNFFAIIQVGKNKYGHPHKEVINKLEKLKIDYWRTDLNGTLIVK